MVDWTTLASVVEAGVGGSKLEDGDEEVVNTTVVAFSVDCAAVVVIFILEVVVSNALPPWS